MVMRIDLDDMNPGMTFPFDEEDPDSWVKLRVLSGGELQQITNRCRTKKVEVKGNPPSRFEVLEFKKGGEEKEFELTWDYCIMDWQGVVDKNGKEIPCTPENKIQLMQGSPAFSTFVSQCIKKINVQRKLQEEDLEKNLQDT